jgi:DNA-binding transcriptional LysR family regulator
MIRLDAVTLRQLRALASVARHGSMTAAAGTLNLSPPAVHSQIKGLEAAFELPLLKRASDSAGSQLTLEGQVLRDAMARIEVILSQAALEIGALRRGFQGRVTLGVVSTGKYFAPRLVKTLRLLVPQIEVVLRIGNRDSVIEDMDRRSIDLAIMGRPPRQPTVDAIPLGPHPHSIVAAPDHPLAALRALSAADLAGETFIAREDGSGTRILMARYLDRLGEGQPFRLVEMGSNESIKQSVMAGLGIAFLSLHTVTDELQRGTLVLLDAPQLPVERHWFLVWRADDIRAPAAEAIADAIIGLRGSYLPDTATVPNPGADRRTAAATPGGISTIPG